MTKDNAREVKYLTPEGGLPSGNWPKDELVAWVPASTLARLEEENARLREALERKEKIVAVFEADVAKAYGLLWRYLGNNKLAHRARGILLPLIGQKGQEAGIAFVKEQYGPITDDEFLMAAEGGVEARTALYATGEDG